MSDNWTIVSPTTLAKLLKSKTVTVGTLVEFEDGEQILVGDVNELCGSCDCCTSYDFDNVVRYRQVYTKEIA